MFSFIKNNCESRKNNEIPSGVFESLKLFRFIKCPCDQVKFFSVTFSAQVFKCWRPLWNYSTWSDMRDTLSMLTTWVDRDFRLSMLVLTCTLFAWFCSWPQQRHENAALNSPRNLPADRHNHRVEKEQILRFQSHRKGLYRSLMCFNAVLASSIL